MRAIPCGPASGADAAGVFADGDVAELMRYLRESPGRNEGQLCNFVPTPSTAQHQNAPGAPPRARHAGLDERLTQQSTVRGAPASRWDDGHGAPLELVGKVALVVPQSSPERMSVVNRTFYGAMVYKIESL